MLARSLLEIMIGIRTGSFVGSSLRDERGNLRVQLTYRGFREVACRSGHAHGWGLGSTGGILLIVYTASHGPLYSCRLYALLTSDSGRDQLHTSNGSVNQCITRDIPCNLGGRRNVRCKH